MKFLKKILIIALKQLDLGSAVAVRLTKLTGKSKVPIHPKHFLEKRPWFVKYIKKGDIVLDLGSGNGQNAIKSAKFAKKIIGLEFNESLLKIARDSVKAKRLKNVEFKKANLEDKIKLNDASVNKVIFLDVLEHLSNRQQALQEIKRVLKSRGLLLVSVPNSQTSWKKLQRSVGVCSFSDPDHKVEFTQKQIESLLEKFGFKTIYLGYSSFDTPLRGLIDILGGFSLTTYKFLTNLRIEAAQKNPQEASGFEIIAQSV